VSSRFLLAQTPACFPLLHSVAFTDSNQAPRPGEIGFPDAAPACPPGGSKDGSFCFYTSRQSTGSLDEPCSQQGWGAEGAVLAVERPPAGGCTGARGASPASGRTARLQCGPAPLALQAAGCPALPGTVRGPQRSPPVLRMLVWKENGLIR
jgi:hypothetical protein